MILRIRKAKSGETSRRSRWVAWLPHSIRHDSQTSAGRLSFNLLHLRATRRDVDNGAQFLRIFSYIIFFFVYSDGALVLSLIHTPDPRESDNPRRISATRDRTCAPYFGGMRFLL